MGNGFTLSIVVNWNTKDLLKGCLESVVTLGRVAGHYLFLSRILPRPLRSDSIFSAAAAEGTIDVDWVSGACLMRRRDILGDRVFDESYFMYGEDIDLCQRIKRRFLHESHGILIHGETAMLARWLTRELTS